MSMIEEHAIVVAVEADGSAWVEASGSRGCNGCAEAGQCGVGLLGRALRARPPRLKLSGDVSLVPGERVVIGLPHQSLLQGTAIVYLLPVAGLFAGAGLGTLLFPGSEGAAMIAAAAGLFGGIAWARKLLDAVQGSLAPTMLRREPGTPGRVDGPLA